MICSWSPCSRSLPMPCVRQNCQATSPKAHPVVQLRRWHLWHSLGRQLHIRTLWEHVPTCFLCLLGLLQTAKVLGSRKLPIAEREDGPKLKALCARPKAQLWMSLRMRMMTSLSLQTIVVFAMARLRPTGSNTARLLRKARRRINQSHTRIIPASANLCFVQLEWSVPTAMYTAIWPRLRKMNVGRSRGTGTQLHALTTVFLLFGPQNQLKSRRWLHGYARRTANRVVGHRKLVLCAFPLKP